MQVSLWVSKKQEDGQAKESEHVVVAQGFLFKGQLFLLVESEGVDPVESVAEGLVAEVGPEHLAPDNLLLAVVKFELEAFLKFGRDVLQLDAVLGLAHDDRDDCLLVLGKLVDAELHWLSEQHG